MPQFFRIQLVLVLTLALSASLALAEETPLQAMMSASQLIALANELAPKVNLFRDAWQKDPDARFFGGTSRDYLYWLKGELRKARNETELKEIITRLKALPFIDVREFIIGESDVDILSEKTGIGLDARDYAVKKIDFIDGSRLDPKTEAGQTGRNQGFIPVEKIILSRNGIVPMREFGNGTREIFTGKLTVHYHEDPEKAQHLEDHQPLCLHSARPGIGTRLWLRFPHELL